MSITALQKKAAPPVWRSRFAKTEPEEPDYLVGTEAIVLRMREAT